MASAVPQEPAPNTATGDPLPSCRLVARGLMSTLDREAARGRAGAFQRGHLTCPRSGERPGTDARAFPGAPRLAYADLRGGPAARDGQWHGPRSGAHLNSSVPAVDSDSLRTARRS